MNHTPSPIQPNEPSDDLPVDHAVDSLLREWLGEETPPDLTSNLDAINRAVVDRRTTPALFTDEELLGAADRAWSETMAGSHVAAFTESYADPKAAFRSSPYARWGALALAASLVGIIIVYPVWRSQKVRKPLANSSQTNEFPQLGSGSESLFVDSKPSASSASNQPKDRSNPTQQSKRSDNPKDTTAKSNPKKPPSKPQPNIASSQPKTDKDSNTVIAADEKPKTPGNVVSEEQIAEIVSVIDGQLQHLWSRVKVAPGKTTDLRSLEDRLAQILIGRQPTDAEREWSRKASAGRNVLQAARGLARRWIESEEFDRHWAAALSDYYLDRSLPIDNKDSLVSFQGWLRESIQTNRPLGSIDQSLIRSDLQPDTPESFWIRRWIALGNKQSGKLITASGRSPVERNNDQMSALETLALQSARLAGRSIPTSAVDGLGIDSDALLGTTAAFASVFQSNKPGLYLSDAEGKVAIIAPTFPDGSPIPNTDSPRDATGQWFEKNSQAREPLVDFVWSRLFGQPLVPPIGLSEQEGSEERKDLLEFLAKKVQSEQASLKQTVLWIAMASPLYLESVQLNPQDYLKLEPSSIAALQKQKRLFAKYPGGPSTSLSNPRSLQSLSSWFKPSSDGNTPSKVLAQPAINPTPGNKPAPSRSIDAGADPDAAKAWGADRIDFEMSNLHPYHRIHEISQSLADSPMNWDTVVDRVFLVALSRYPSEEERQQANDLLSWSDGDRRTASSRLLNAILGHP
jgi:hypothetical protein